LLDSLATMPPLAVYAVLAGYGALVLYSVSLNIAITY